MLFGTYIPHSILHIVSSEITQEREINNCLSMLEASLGYYVIHEENW